MNNPIPLYQIDAFSGELFKGNPAAVCPLDEWLPDDVMQQIAAENNLSETAFLVDENEGYRIRWFTPITEVSLCGHATLAAAFVLFELLKYDKETIEFSSASGPLQVHREDEWLVMNFPAQPAQPCPTPDRFAEALGTAPVDLRAAEDYLAVFENEEIIVSIEPDFDALSQLDLRGVIITAPGNTADFVSRFFAPKFSIDEDPVTGSAHCTLAPYWADRFGKRRLFARQLSQRGGELRCEVQNGRVLISGKAVKYLEGNIDLKLQ